MSLINEALRKAQRDRSPRPDAGQAESDPTTGGSPAEGRSSYPGWLIGLGIFLVVLLIGLLATIGLLLLRQPSPVPATAETTAPILAPVDSPAPVTSTPSPPPPAPQAEAGPEPAAPTAGTIFDRSNAATTPAPAVDSLVNELKEAREAAEAQLAAEEMAARQAEAAAADTTPKIVDWLTQSRINGVRLSPGENKVILNGQAYSEGEIVQFELGLRVTRIEESRVLFEDATGKKYMKRR